MECAQIILGIFMIFQTLKFIINHPLCEGRKFAALKDWFSWQLAARLLSGPTIVPFVNESKLLVSVGMTGATGNIYVGLAEFEEMAFLLHFLRQGDLFVDAGANVGVYTVLASCAIGCRSVAVEAQPATFLKLTDNLRLNDIGAKVEALNFALGEENGELRFTSELDTMNHVLAEGESAEAITVQVYPLDTVLEGRRPQLIKIDVEGFETLVIGGARETLVLPDQMAIIMELNGCGARYGFRDEELHCTMIDGGYVSTTYNPMSRKLNILDKPILKEGNIIYVKKECMEEVENRLLSAPAFDVKGWSI